MTYPENETNPAVVLHGINDLRVEPRALPSLTKPTDLLLRITHTGICGSDVHYMTHGRIGPFICTGPMVLGHESAGTIVAAGSAVDTSVYPVGARVAIEPGTPCRTCARCKAGQYNLCPGMQFAATPPIDGTLAKYVTMPADMCLPLPDNVSQEEGAMLEPLAVGVHVMKSQGEVQPGDLVVIFGAGPVGLLCAAVARARGAGFVVVVDVAEKRLGYVEGLTNNGGIAGFNSSGCKSYQEIVEKLMDKFPRLKQAGGAHRAVDATGVELCIQASIGILRPGGTFVQAGMGRDMITIPILEIVGKEITVKGCFRYFAGDYEEALRLVKEGLVNLKSLVTHRFKFEDAKEAFETVKRGEGVKVVIEGPRD